MVGYHHAVDIEAILLDSRQVGVGLAICNDELHLAFVVTCEPIHDGNDFAAKGSTVEVEVGQCQVFACWGGDFTGASVALAWRRCLASTARDQHQAGYHSYSGFDHANRLARKSAVANALHGVDIFAPAAAFPPIWCCSPHCGHQQGH